MMPPTFVLLEVGHRRQRDSGSRRPRRGTYPRALLVSDRVSAHLQPRAFISKRALAASRPCTGRSKENPRHPTMRCGRTPTPPSIRSGRHPSGAAVPTAAAPVGAAVEATDSSPPPQQPGAVSRRSHVFRLDRSGSSERGPGAAGGSVEGVLVSPAPGRST